MDPSWKFCPVCIAPLAGWLVALKDDGSPEKSYTLPIPLFQFLMPKTDI